MYVIDLGWIDFEYNWFVWNNVKGLVLSNLGVIYLCFCELSLNKLDLILIIIFLKKGW